MLPTYGGRLAIFTLGLCTRSGTPRGPCRASGQQRLEL